MIIWCAVFCIIWWFCQFTHMTIMQLEIKILRKKSKLNFESSKIEVKKVFRILLSIAFHCTRFFFSFSVGLLRFLHNIWRVISFFWFNHITDFSWMKITKFLLFLEKKNRVIRLFSWIYPILKAKYIFKKEKKTKLWNVKNAHLALY